MPSIYDTLTLGELEAALANLPDRLEITLDFARLRPHQINSWRGDYSHLAIAYRDPAEAVTIGVLREWLASAHTRYFDGYKGGRYRPTKDTPVWIDNWGECTSTTITGVVRIDGVAIIQTSTTDSI